MIYLKASTASQEVLLGPFLDSTDGDTEETGLTIANTDVKVWKAGATTLANKNSGGATHISDGLYYATLDATDTDTVGSGYLYVHVSGALAVKVPFTVLPGQVYDSLIAGTDDLDVEVASLASAALTAINGEVDDVLNTDASAEPGSVPAANASIGAKIDWIFALARNKRTQTSSSKALRNDSDTGNIATATVSDDSTTFTQGEWT